MVFIINILFHEIWLFGDIVEFVTLVIVNSINSFYLNKL